MPAREHVHDKDCHLGNNWVTCPACQESLQNIETLIAHNMKKKPTAKAPKQPKPPASPVTPEILINLGFKAVSRYGSIVYENEKLDYTIDADNLKNWATLKDFTQYLFSRAFDKGVRAVNRIIADPVRFAGENNPFKRKKS